MLQLKSNYCYNESYDLHFVESSMITTAINASNMCIVTCAVYNESYSYRSTAVFPTEQQYPPTQTDTHTHTHTHTHTLALMTISQCMAKQAFTIMVICSSSPLAGQLSVR